MNVPNLYIIVMSSIFLFTERQENIRSDATVYAFPTSRSWRTGLSALSPVNKGSTTDDTPISSSIATMQSFLYSFTNSYWSKKTTTNLGMSEIPEGNCRHDLNAGTSVARGGVSTNNGERSMDVVSEEDMGDDELAVDTDMNEVNDDELAVDTDMNEVSVDELAADNDTSVDDQE